MPYAFLVYEPLTNMNYELKGSTLQLASLDTELVVMLACLNQHETLCEHENMVYIDTFRRNMSNAVNRPIRQFCNLLHTVYPNKL